MTSERDFIVSSMVLSRRRICYGIDSRLIIGSCRTSSNIEVEQCKAAGEELLGRHSGPSAGTTTARTYLPTGSLYGGDDKGNDQMLKATISSTICELMNCGEYLSC